MILDPYIQKLIRERLGCALSRPSEFEALALDIETATGEHIGVNTLKRLFGLLSEVTPTETTLNVVARYLGYGSWRLLKKAVDDKNSVIDEDTSAVYPGMSRIASFFWQSRPTACAGWRKSAAANCRWATGSMCLLSSLLSPSMQNASCAMARTWAAIQAA